MARTPDQELLIKYAQHFSKIPHIHDTQKRQKLLLEKLLEVLGLRAIWTDQGIVLKRIPASERPLQFYGLRKSAKRKTTKKVRPAHNLQDQVQTEGVR
jgi:hypothetical protein